MHHPDTIDTDLELSSSQENQNLVVSSVRQWGRGRGILQRNVDILPVSYQRPYMEHCYSDNIDVSLKL